MTDLKLRETARQSGTICEGQNSGLDAHLVQEGRQDEFDSIVRCGIARRHGLC